MIAEEKAARDREVEVKKQQGRQTLELFLEAAGAAQNPGAALLWPEPSAEDYGERYKREVRRGWRDSRHDRSILAEWRRSRHEKVLEAAQSEYMRTHKPSGRGWLFDVGFSNSASGGSITSAAGRSLDVPITMEYHWFPVVLTTGEIRACRDEIRPWKREGFPFLCSAESSVGRDLARMIDDRSIYWYGCLSAPDIRTRAEQLGIDIPES